MRFAAIGSLNRVSKSMWIDCLQFLEERYQPKFFLTNAGTYNEVLEKAKSLNAEILIGPREWVEGDGEHGGGYIQTAYEAALDEGGFDWIIMAHPLHRFHLEKFPKADVLLVKLFCVRITEEDREKALTELRLVEPEYFWAVGAVRPVRGFAFMASDECWPMGATSIGYGGYGKSYLKCGFLNPAQIKKRIFGQKDDKIIVDPIAYSKKSSHGTDLIHETLSLEKGIPLWTPVGMIYD